MGPLRLAPALSAGDPVALISPASWSDDDWVQWSVAEVDSWGLRPRLGVHARDQRGYLAGRDEDRLADLNDAIRDPDVRAIVTLRGGCGSFRLVHGVDVDSLRADPKPLVGFSDVTSLHHVWHLAGTASLHGAVAGAHAEDVRDLLLGGKPGPVKADPTQFGAELTTRGRASGPLTGGALELLARSVGVLDFDLSGHVLLLEISKTAGLGNVDRALTQLIMSGSLEGITGVALGRLSGFEAHEDRGWTIIDLLRDRFAVLDVPVLAGLPLGHGADPRTVPLGVGCTVDADAGTLTCERPTQP
ncbi:muramoyltetrapeptide carboxypeptidase [Haloactinopolyspora alba]|uniref:Muramoyltetrapeptide carboxypeptidase n=1 Tax=Haloactinopolyspora alba TaxID=648780 RepID=A0A2P8DX49_9ACTN|nr:LD-carboxypeptidase [Haloactinopolyspora alba]PSL01796.1 muramoyltetrapeptide carboxypeptidase [Haloactinopolyspora alba]